ncbi:hypothetical protein C0389_06485 [bacterium]|nr:hypothetical protein [bacterium]
MNTTLKPVAVIYKVNSTLFVNSFKDVDEKAALKRPNKKTNSMIFIALHLIDARNFILTQLGIKTKHPFAKYMDWADSIDEIKIYPKLSRVLSEWKKLDPVLMKKLNSLSQKQLEIKMNIDFPGGKRVLNMITFLSEHEAYHVGQLGMLRKFYGLPATQY